MKKRLKCPKCNKKVETNAIYKYYCDKKRGGCGKTTDLSKINYEVIDSEREVMFGMRQ